MDIEIAVGAQIQLGQLDIALPGPSSFVLDRDQFFDQADRLRFRQAVAQSLETLGERIAARHPAARHRQRIHRRADTVGEFGDRAHALGVRRRGGREQTTHVAFGRDQRIGDGRHFGHRKRAVHGMDRADQRFVGGGRRAARARQPAFYRAEVSADFRLQNLEQHGIDADRDAFFLLDHRASGVFGFNRLELDDRRGLDGSQGDDRRHHFLATGDALGEGFHRTQIGGDRALAAQRGVQLRQGRVGLLDHRDHRRCRRAQSIAHLVQHVLDLPAELAERFGADQPAAALQRVEDPANGLQTFDTVGFRFPRRQQLRKVADLFLEFFQEDFADFVVDIVAGDVEARGQRGGRRRRRYGRRHGLCRRWCRDLRRRHGCGSDRLARWEEQGHERRRRWRHDGFGRLGSRHLDDGLRDLRRFEDRRLEDRCLRNRLHGLQRRVHRNVGDRLCDLQRMGLGDFRGRRCNLRKHIFQKHCFRKHDLRRFGRQRFDSRHGFRRQRPVPQVFETVAGDIEDIVAIGAMFAQRFEVILDARERIREGVELAAVGNAAAFEQFDFGVEPHAIEILSGLQQFEDIERAGHFAQQFRHLRQFGVIPAGFDESDEGLARAGEVGDRLADQDIEHLAGFSAGEIFLVIGAIAAGEAGDLVVQRCVDIQQRAGDFQQRGFIGLALAFDDFAHRVALLQHEAAGQPKPQHAERVGHVLQAFGLRLKLDRIGLGGAQIQVQLVLHAQQVFLDRGGHGVEQRAIAAGDAAAGVIEFGFGRLERVEIEHFAQFHQRRVNRFALRDVIEQLPGRFERGVRAWRIEATLLELAAGLAIDAGEGLAQTRIHREAAIA